MFPPKELTWRYKKCFPNMLVYGLENTCFEIRNVGYFLVRKNGLCEWRFSWIYSVNLFSVSGSFGY